MRVGEFKGHKHMSRHDGSTTDAWLSYKCAHCDTSVSGAVVTSYSNGIGTIKWLLCSNCGEGSVQTSDGLVYPGALPGPAIEGLPDDVKAAYKEARACISANALTACELMCRKILMHIAVEKGAAEGDTFATYLTFLEGLGYVTPPMKKWVDLIRQHGNQATHRLAAPQRDRAESTLFFTAELLRLVYEMEYLASKYAAPPV